MFKRITEGISRYYHQETWAERSIRMLPGAIYSATAVITFLIVSSLINVIIFRNLHLAVDWIGLLLRCIEFGLIMAAAGAIVGWFTETYEGIVYGGVVLAVLIFLGNMAASTVSGRGGSLLGQSIIIVVLPLVGAGILLAGAIRVALNRHVKIRQQEDPRIQHKQSIQLIALVFLVGLVIGVFSLFGTTSLNAVRSLNSNLQNYAADPMIEQRFPYERVPGLKAHFGMSYSLYARTAYTTADSLEITIHFADGYTVTCVVPLLGGNEQLLLNTCNEGSTIKSP
jgi:hypothetical protein